jgi:hypothetical protein
MKTTGKCGICGCEWDGCVCVFVPKLIAGG